MRVGTEERRHLLASDLCVGSASRSCSHPAYNAQHVRRIYSKVAQPVTIADRRGIQTATIIAEEKAKAAIVRFLQQDVVSGRAATLSQSIQKGGTGGDAISTTDQRNVVQGLSQFTGSVSRGTLAGVVVLESWYDPKKK